MECKECLQIFSAIGEAFNSTLSTSALLEHVARAVTENMGLKGCHFRILSRDQKILEHVAAYGLSREFLDKGPVDAERSVTEALEGRMALVLDCGTDPRVQYPGAHTAEGIASCLIVPLMTRGQVIGIMRLYKADPGDFSQLEKEIAAITADFATRAMTHAMFHAILDNVTDAIRTSLDLNLVLQKIVTQICEDLRAKGATIHLFGAGDALVRSAANGLHAAYLDTTCDLIVADVARHMDGKCVQIFDPDEDDHVADTGAIKREGIASQLFVPLAVRDNFLGVLGLYTHHPYLFSEDELYFMESIGYQCALAIQNARMYERIADQYAKLRDDFQIWFGHHAGPGSKTPGVGTQEAKAREGQA